MRINIFYELMQVLRMAFDSLMKLLNKMLNNIKEIKPIQLSGVECSHIHGYFIAIKLILRRVETRARLRRLLILTSRNNGSR